MGKITVLLKSVDEPDPVHERRQPVNGRPGYVGGGTIIFRDAGGHWADIQVPASLVWDAARTAALSKPKLIRAQAADPPAGHSRVK